jgi:predicted NBD/HSP70 family sugar kinase
MIRGPIAKDLRERNRARVLRHILRAGVTTRARIAEECNISAASAANVVSDLMQEGLVEESGMLPSAGGRPIAQISTVPSSAHAIGVVVGEHGVTVELFDLAFTPLDRVFTSIADRRSNPGPVADAVLKGVSLMREKHPEVESTLLGVGLGLPGIIDLDEADGPVIYAQTLGWPPVRLSDLFAGSDLRIFADNGAKALTMSEQWFGAAQGVENGIVALIGRGIGVGVISGGRLLRGASSSAGEWGHTKVSLGGPACRCGARGCLEAYVGGEAILRRWNEAGAGFEGTEEAALTELIKRADDGDATATTVLDETLEILGVGLGNLVNLFNPERIVIGAWAGEQLVSARRSELEERVRANSLDRPGRQFELVRCKLGDDSIPLGAALLPIEQLIENTISRMVPA